MNNQTDKEILLHMSQGLVLRQSNFEQLAPCDQDIPLTDINIGRLRGSVLSGDGEWRMEVFCANLIL